MGRTSGRAGLAGVRRKPTPGLCVRLCHDPKRTAIGASGGCASVSRYATVLIHCLRDHVIASDQGFTLTFSSVARPSQTSGVSWSRNPISKGKSMFKSLALSVVGLLVLLKEPPKRDERGLSQSAETAILVAGAVAVAVIVVALITTYVRDKISAIP